MQQDIQQDILHTYIVHVVVELFVDKVAVRQTSKSLLIVCTANCANLARACGSAHRRQRNRQQRSILCQRTCSPVEGLQHWVCLRHRRRRCRFRPHGVPVQQQHARSQITATDMRSLPACSTSPICSSPSFQGDAAVLTSRTQSPCGCKSPDGDALQTLCAPVLGEELDLLLAGQPRLRLFQHLLDLLIRLRAHAHRGLCARYAVVLHANVRSFSESRP